MTDELKKAQEDVEQAEEALDQVIEDLMLPPAQETKPDGPEWPVTQLLRPHDMQRKTFSPVTEAVFVMAESIDAVITAEVLGTGEVVLYGRRRADPEDSEISEFADNAATEGDTCPREVVEKVIRRLHERGLVDAA